MIVARAERGSARVAEVLRTSELTPFSLVVESDLRVARTCSTTLGAKYRIQEQLGVAAFGEYSV